MNNRPDRLPNRGPQIATCQNVDWYSEGEARIVSVTGIEVRIRFVGRKGRRGRILIQAPEGAEFRSDDGRPE